MRPSEELPAWLVTQVADTVLTHAPVPMALLNVELRHVTVNNALARLYAVDPQDAIGATPSQLLGQLGGQIASRCRAVVTDRRPAIGHVVNGMTAASPDAEVHWQIDCLPLDSPTSAGALLLIVNDITARTRAMRSLNDQRRALAYQASHDAVTGLANRFQLLEFLQRQLAGRRPPTVLLVDLDGFKQINDEHGHSAGDHILATVAERLRGAVPGEELVARYGGDEFVVAMREAGDADGLCERLQRTISQPIVWGGRPLVVGASIGWSTGVEGDTVLTLLNRADDHMYRVKEQRRQHR